MTKTITPEEQQSTQEFVKPILNQEAEIDFQIEQATLR